MLSKMCIRDRIREDVREDVGSRGGSKPALRPVGGTVSNEAQATESIIDNGDVEDKRAGEDAGRGSGTAVSYTHLILISKRQRRSGQILEMICAMVW